MNLAPICPPLRNGQHVQCSYCLKMRSDVQAVTDGKPWTFCCAECSQRVTADVVSALEAAYVELLGHWPMDRRIRGQGLLCQIRNALARATGRGLQETQEHYEAMAQEASVKP